MARLDPRGGLPALLRGLGVGALCVAFLCAGFAPSARAERPAPVDAEGYQPPPAYPPTSPPPVVHPRPPAQDIGLAVQDGTNDAETQISGLAWFGIGCLTSWIGVIIGYANRPTPDGSRLIGMSPAYVVAYTAAYQRAGESYRGTHALAGALTGCVAFIVLVGAIDESIVNASSGCRVP